MLRRSSASRLQPKGLQTGFDAESTTWQGGSIPLLAFFRIRDMGKSVIQKHKRLIRKLDDLRAEDMFIGIDLDFEIKSRKNLIRNYSIICNEIYNGSRAEDKKLKKELKKMIENKKLRIAELLKDKVESKKELRKIHKQLSDLL